MKRDERFEILERIQDGMLATSYKARDRVLDRTVLLKVLHPSQARDTDMVQRFRREAMLQARLKHPNIVTVYDFGTEDDFYIASEFIEGMTFERHLKERGRLGPGEFAPVVVQVSHALAFAHEHGVVHRDLKPGNIMIASQGDSKLTDFGLAFARDLGQLTQEGGVVGTPAYMSPEQARGRRTDARTDIFSLGIVIYEALTGVNPFRADSLADSLSLVLNHEPRPLEQAAPGLPRVLCLLVDRMLAKNPDSRMSNVAEVAKVFSELSPAALTPVLSSKARTLRRRLVPALAGGGTAVLAAVLILVFHARRPAPAGGLALYAALSESAAARVPESSAGDSESSSSMRTRGAATDAGESRGTDRTLSERTQPAAGIVAPTLCSLRLAVLPWAEVSIDGQPVGVTPLVGPLALAPGPHVLEMKNPYYPILRQRIDLREPMSSTTIVLDREYAFADIRVTPWAEVSIDGRVVDTTPLDRPVPLTLGGHLLTISHPGLGTRTETINTDSARTYRFTFDLRER